MRARVSLDSRKGKGWDGWQEGGCKPSLASRTSRGCPCCAVRLDTARLVKDTLEKTPKPQVMKVRLGWGCGGRAL